MDNEIIPHLEKLLDMSNLDNCESSKDMQSALENIYNYIEDLLNKLDGK